MSLDTKLKLGVLITYHDEKDMLRECLDSLLNQKEKPDEILVYDDASSYPAKDYVREDWPIEIVRGEENEGPSFGRNKLLKLSKSDYVHLHDADDLFHPQWCEKVRLAIEQSNADIIFTEVQSFRGDTLVSGHVLDLDRLSLYQDLVRFALNGIILIPATTFRKDLALKIGGFRPKEVLPQSEDFDFNVRLAATGATYKEIAEPLIIQRLRPESHSRYKKECWVSILKAIRLFSEEIQSRYRQDFTELAASTGSKLFNIGAYCEAKEAFYVSNEFGKATFATKGRLYRIVAKILGPYRTEQIGKIYRNVIPETIRCRLAKRGF